MEIIVTGSGCRIREHVEDIARFSAEMLMPKLSPSLFLKIELIPNLLKKEGIYGDCGPDDFSDDFNRPRDFVIRTDSRIDKRKLLLTICHEMVHVKQYARGELYYSSRKSMNRWQGAWIKKDLDYWDSPWEIEAMGRESGLFVRWAKSRKLIKQKWAQEP